MAAVIGNLEPFQSEVEEFPLYLERFEQFVKVNDVKPEKVVPLFLTLIGPNVYGVLRNLLIPEVPSAKSFKELQTVLTNHYAPQRLIIAERFRFNQRNQKENESINDYVIALKKLVTFCNFGTFLNDALRDRFVCGIRSEQTQRKLLAENKISFEDAVSIAQAMEMTETQMGAIGIQTQQQLHKLDPNKQIEQPVDVKVRKPCPRCNLTNHGESQCRAKSWKCFSCGKVGHTSKVCRNKSKTVKAVGTEDEMQQFNVYQGSRQTGICSTVLTVNNSRVKMEIDSGAGVSIMSVAQYKDFFSNIPLEKSTAKLVSASGKDVNVVGQIYVNVLHKNNVHQLKLIIVKSRIPLPLLGRSWLDVLKPNWREELAIKAVNKVKESGNVVEVSAKANTVKKEAEEVNQSQLINRLKEQYPNVFSNNTSSRIRNFKANIVLKEDVSPIFKKAYDVPYKVLPKVEAELEELVQNGTLEKVRHSDWASPIVVVPKKDSDRVRICIDYKKTVNTVTRTDIYPLPRKEDIFARCMGKCFCTLDLKTAYLQMELSDEAKKILVINTHMGLFQINSLPYGINSGPSIFQGMMDNILKDIPGVSCFIDDVLISGENKNECLLRLHKVLQVLNEYNVRINVEKSVWLKQSVVYLGHELDSQGIHPLRDKVDSISNWPTPQNVSQLKAYLGMLNYYSCFLPMVSSKLKKLYSLLEKNVKWNWDKDCERCFSESKLLLKQHNVLTYFDPKLPLHVITDASPYGVGAVLCHVIEGVEKPIYCVSATLSRAEQNYSQIEREALAVIFSVKKFHKYLYGNKFTIFTDAQALQKILGPKTGIPTLAASRMQRWALILAGYNYDLKYRKDVRHADALSRLPSSESTEDKECIFVVDVPLSNEDIQKATVKDVILSKVLELTKAGWPNNVDESLSPYFSKRNELTITGDCLCWGNRLVIPQSLREQVLELLHEQHPGIVRMKMLARANLWWPGIDKDIENKSLTCEKCQLTQKGSPNKNLLSWPNTSKNFERVHLDFFHFKGFNVLLLVDTYSKWLELWPLKTTNCAQILIPLKQCFATFGLPVEIVSDGGPPFNSNEWYEFGKQYNIKISKSPAYHPQSNGAAERNVQTVKYALEKQLVLERQKILTFQDFQEHLTSFLMNYRNTPSTVTGLSPSDLMLKQRPRTKLTMIKPEYKVHNKTDSKSGCTGSPTVMFEVGETVLVKSTVKNIVKFIFGKIIKCISPVTYLVYCNHRIRFVHADHLKKTIVKDFEKEKLEPECHVPSSVITNAETDSMNNDDNPVLEEEDQTEPDPIAPNVPPVLLRRSGRKIIPPERLNL